MKIARTLFLAPLLIGCATTPMDLATIDLIDAAGAGCVVDADAGLLEVAGAMPSIPLDTSKGTTIGYSLKCANGDGKSQVLKFTLGAGAGFGFGYSEVEAQAFGLFGDPKGGSCDAVPIDCRAPLVKNAVEDFGARPAGIYYLIVEAQAAGNEGVVTINPFAYKP